MRPKPVELDKIEVPDIDEEAPLEDFLSMDENEDDILGEESDEELPALKAAKDAKKAEEEQK